MSRNNRDRQRRPRHEVPRRRGSRVNVWHLSPVGLGSQGNSSWWSTPTGTAVERFKRLDDDDTEGHGD